jgi:hypothetical protein
MWIKEIDLLGLQIHKSAEQFKIKNQISVFNIMATLGTIKKYTVKMWLKHG